MVTLSLQNQSIVSIKRKFSECALWGVLALLHHPRKIQPDKVRIKNISLETKLMELI